MSEQPKAPEGAAPESAAEGHDDTYRRRKSRVGTVVRAKMTKTVIVVVERRVREANYKKYVTRKKKYAVHDELGCKEGERVRIKETRPMSKTKRWRVVEKLAPGVA